MTSTFTPALSRQLEWAAQVVEGVRCGRSLTEVLAALPSDLRPGVQAIASDALRRLGAASEVRARLAARAPPPWVDALLLVALTLLWPAPAPAYAPHTVVDQAVQAAKARAPASAGFVNALLRRFLREREGLLAAIATLPQARWNHPRWWVDRLRADWPQSWQALLAAADQRPPMTLRVNRRRMSGASYLQHLQAAGQAATLLPGPDLGGQALVLHKPCPVEQLPGFADGWASVQDAAAQRAAALLLGPAGLGAGARVLDACAAPGGKTAHLLESADLDLLALDSDPARLDRVSSTLERLRLVARLQAADARRRADWWDGRPFDAILLDAPCSASGIVRRHPDIRWLRRPGDIEALARTQGELLDALWPTLGIGGRLLYATCSVFKAEGQGVIDAFLQRRGSGEVRLDPASPGHLLSLADNSPAAQRARELPEPPALPDGFFYALLHKT